MWKLVPATVLMIGLGTGRNLGGQRHEVAFLGAAMIPFVYILWVLYGQLKQHQAVNQERLQVPLRTQHMFFC